MVKGISNKKTAGQVGQLMQPVAAGQSDMRIHQASTKLMDVANLKKKEQEREAALSKDCEMAMMGIGRVNISKIRGRLVLQKFNPTRQIQVELVKKISGMIRVGDCQADTNPLIVAVNPSCIDDNTLSDSYDVKNRTSQLPKVGFLNQEQKIYLLGGLHRVLAVEKATEWLRKEMERGQEQLEKYREAKGNMEYDLEERDEAEEKMEGGIKTSKDLIKKAEVWPVWFYDIGEPLSL
jgi:hypothetical protein